MWLGTTTRLIPTGGHVHQDAIVCAFPATVNGYPTTIVRMTPAELTVLGACHMKAHCDGQAVEIAFKGGFRLRLTARVEAVKPDSNALAIRRIGELERKILSEVMLAVQMRTAREIVRELTDTVIRIGPDGVVREVPLY